MYYVMKRKCYFGLDIHVQKYFNQVFKLHTKVTTALFFIVIVQLKNIDGL